MPTLPYEKRQKIIKQALSEISFARQYKQGKVINWKKNEDLYYGKKTATDTSRANVDLARMQEFVHTLLSKIDNPLVFKYTKRKESQLKRVERLNALRAYDSQRDNWDIKDIVGKKQAIIYGRAIYSYFSEFNNGYKPHLDNIDVYDFLIDPSAGGIDIEQALYLGDYGVVLTKDDLRKGVKNKTYLKTETEQLLEGSGNAGSLNQETTNKNSRTYGQNVSTANKENGNPDKFKFWRWGTTFEGQRYYLLLSEDGGTAIRVEEIEEVFESGLWWYWTWACFPDLTEFWTPSYCDYVREIFMAQAVSINQMLDNAEQINNPQKVVNVGAIENLAELKYRRGGGYIKVKEAFDVERALQTVKVPSIDTPLKVFDILESIQQKSSGVTDASKGVDDPNGKVGIYEGNAANTADRFGYLNKSYSFGYKRFATLYEHGVRENLIKKEAVDILGPDGIEIEYIKRNDIFRKNDTFGVIVEASNAELALSEGEKRTKMAFLQAQAMNPAVNPQKSFEIQASIAGFSEEEIRQLQDTSDFGDAGIMSEAERDIEALLDGKKIKPNQVATSAYKQRFVDYMRDNDEDITPDQFRTLAGYVLLLDPIIARNMARGAQQKIMKQGLSLVPPGGQLPGETVQQGQMTEEQFNQQPVI